MSSTNFYNSLDYKYLLDFANLKGGLIRFQKNFLSKDQFKNFINKSYKGIPLIIPYGLSAFDYSKAKGSFKIMPEDILKIYKTRNRYYKPMLYFFNQENIYCTGAKPKKKFKDLVEKIIMHNNDVKKKIKIISKKKSLVAFQTRNIPHLGHEEIIKAACKKYDKVIINPIIGPKKSGDVNFAYLKKAFKFLISNKYKKKLVYLPFYASFFYAGPKEAIHHANLRYKLGIKNFIIGRDHAGSENNYKPLESINFAKKIEKKINVKIFNTEGAYFCKKCKMYVLGKCKIHKKSYLYDISGTNFRKNILKNKIFLHADKSMQNHLLKNNPNKIFVK
tara:strand:+ start:1807 stop:2805 length:999 start_codon:yes stop_codon:yes gene_type:complete